MTADEVLIELLDRLASVRGDAVLISHCELLTRPSNTL